MRYWKRTNDSISRIKQRLNSSELKLIKRIEGEWMEEEMYKRDKRYREMGKRGRERERKKRERYLLTVTFYLPQSPAHHSEEFHFCADHLIVP